MNPKLRSIIYMGLLLGGIYCKGMFDETFAGRIIPMIVMLIATLLMCFDKEYGRNSPIPKWVFVAVVLLMIVYSIWRHP